jgi:hypothetical protein
MLDYLTTSSLHESRLETDETIATYARATFAFKNLLLFSIYQPAIILHMQNHP